MSPFNHKYKLELDENYCNIFKDSNQRKWCDIIRQEKSTLQCFADQSKIIIKSLDKCLTAAFDCAA